MPEAKQTRDPTEFTVQLEDTMVVAYLKLKGHICIPWISRDDPDDIRVSFDIQGDKQVIESDTQKYYDPNESVLIQDYIRCLKDIKSQMYNMRRIGKK